MKGKKSRSGKVGREGLDKKSKLRLHFMPNSHLDREWGMNFQQTRKLTVDFIDGLLDIFQKVPEYTFLLDSQTVPLEDYLAIRPEKEKEIKNLVKSKRLAIGPWYTAPDCYTLSGESIVRNLIIGHKIAAKFGGVMKTGYTPFGFGQISQLPQVYNEFGIDTILFYRYIPKDDAPNAEFLWESPDGTTAFCSRFGIGSRYNFFFYVWRPVMNGGKKLLDRISNWKDGGAPFKFVDKENRYENYWMPEAALTLEKKRIMPAVNDLLKKEKEQFLTPAIALMQGMDTSAPDLREVEIINIIREELKGEAELFFSNLDDYMAEVKSYIKENNIELKHFTGEMRRPGNAHYFTSINSDIISSRIRQKILGKKAEMYLQRWAEPFAAMASMYGYEYPENYLELAWKYLLKCHAHDTVGGCGIDDVQVDAEYRLRQVLNISKFVRRDALQTICKFISNADVKDDEIVITVFNPSAFTRTEVVKVYTDCPADLKIVHLGIFDSEDNKVEMYEGPRKQTEKVLRANGDAPNAYVGEEIELTFLAENIPAMGYKTFIVRNHEHAYLEFPHIAAAPNVMENDFIKLTVKPDGSIKLFDKKTKKSYKNLNVFEDGGEAGDPWNYHAPMRDNVVLSLGSPVRISLVENSHLSATVKVVVEMQIPAKMNFDNNHWDSWRSEEMIPMPVTSYMTVKKDSPVVEFETHVDNKATHHRLRVLFPTGIETDHADSDQGFDVVSRKILRDEEHPFRHTFNQPSPMLSFVDVSDQEKGLAIMSQGIHEHETIDDEKRTVALTLLRCFEIALCTVSYRWERLPEMELSHSPGKHVFKYALYPHSGNWETGNVPKYSEIFNMPVLPSQSTRNNGKMLPKDGSFINIESDVIQVSCIKKSEDGKDIILRVFNPSENMQAADISFGFNIKAASYVTSGEIPASGVEMLKVEGNSIRIEAEKKKIVTIRIRRK